MNAHRIAPKLAPATIDFVAPKIMTHLALSEMAQTLEPVIFRIMQLHGQYPAEQAFHGLPDIERYALRKMAERFVLHLNPLVSIEATQKAADAIAYDLYSDRDGVFDLGATARLDDYQEAAEAVTTRFASAYDAALSDVWRARAKEAR
jgi:hypothetical protein